VYLHAILARDLKSPITIVHKWTLDQIISHVELGSGRAERDLTYFCWPKPDPTQALGCKSWPVLARCVARQPAGWPGAEVLRSSSCLDEGILGRHAAGPPRCLAAARATPLGHLTAWTPRRAKEIGRAGAYRCGEGRGRLACCVRPAARGGGGAAVCFVGLGR
jgi:hypothetical protein